MRKIILLCATLFTMVLSISASPVLAQSVLWVGPNGNDNNGCNTTAPCATFQGAISKGNVGQINCLGSGNYGAVTITGSVTIDCGTGNVGNVVAGGSGNSAITINTSSAAIIVLRHLALNGLGMAFEGINAQSFSSGTLIVEDCMIHGFLQGQGIDFEPQSGRGFLQVSNSQVFDNTAGILVEPASGQIASATLNRVEMIANSLFGLGLEGAGVVAGTMRDSVVGGNGNAGVFAFAGQVFFTVEESSIVDNLGIGIQTFSAGSAIKVAASTIGGNGTGIDTTHGGSIVSFGDNHVSDNGVNGSFTSTKALQ